MGLFDRLFGAPSSELDELRSKVVALEEQRAITDLPWNVGALDSTAVTPTPQRALKLAPVYGATSLIARSISTLPMHAYRRIGVDQRTRMPYLPKLFQAPSVHGELTDWLHRCLISLLLWGNAYGLITQRDGLGYPTGVEWLDPAQVAVLDEAVTGRGSFWNPIYYFRGREIDAENIVHIPWYTVPFRVKGLSPLGAFASSVEVGLEGQTYVRDWFKNGGIPPGTFKNAERKVPQPESDQIRDRLVSSIKSHKPLVYGADWDYKPISINPQEAAFVQAYQLSATDIAMVYGIYPAERIGGTSARSNTYANVEAEQIQFATLTLQPYVSKLESYFFDLLPEPQFVRLMMEAGIRTDTKTRYETHQIARTIGLNNVDELREQEDMAPLPNGEGQEYKPLVIVHELIRAAAQTMGDPNMPGFESTEPIPPGAAGAPGAAPNGSAPGSAPPGSAPGQPVTPGGRFTGAPGELVVAGAATPSQNGRHAPEDEEVGLPPF